MNLDKCFCSSVKCEVKEKCDRHIERSFEFFDRNPQLRKPVYQTDFYQPDRECEIFEKRENNERTAKS